MSIYTLYQKDKLSASRLFIFLIIYLSGKKTDHLRMKREEIRRENARALAAKVGGQTEFGKRVGMDTSQVSQIIGKTPTKNIGNSIAPRIELAFGLLPGDLDVILPVSATTQSDVEDAPAIVGTLKHIPVVGRVQAGPDGLLHIDDFSQIEGNMLWYATCDHAYALRIRGESMSPRYLPGEFVGVDPCADVTPSDEVIVLLRDGRRMIKRLLWKRDDQACFESVNKNFQNIVLDMEEIDAMHLVLGNIPKAAFRAV